MMAFGGMAGCRVDMRDVRTGQEGRSQPPKEPRLAGRPASAG